MRVSGLWGSTRSARLLRNRAIPPGGIRLGPAPGGSRDKIGTDGAVGLGPSGGPEAGTGARTHGWAFGHGGTKLALRLVAARRHESGRSSKVHHDSLEVPIHVVDDLGKLESIELAVVGGCGLLTTCALAPSRAILACEVAWRGAAICPLSRSWARARTPAARSPGSA